MSSLQAFLNSHTSTNNNCRNGAISHAHIHQQHGPIHNNFINDDRSTRFQDLLKVCEGISKKTTKDATSQNSITQSTNTHAYTRTIPHLRQSPAEIDLECTDETIEQMLGSSKIRSLGYCEHMGSLSHRNTHERIKSSRSFRLDLPEILEKPYLENEEDDEGLVKRNNYSRNSDREYQSTKNVCLTSRAVRSSLNSYSSTKPKNTTAAPHSIKTKKNHTKSISDRNKNKKTPSTKQNLHLSPTPTTATKTQTTTHKKTKTTAQLSQMKMLENHREVGGIMGQGNCQEMEMQYYSITENTSRNHNQKIGNLHHQRDSSFKERLQVSDFDCVQKEESLQNSTLIQQKKLSGQNGNISHIYSKSSVVDNLSTNRSTISRSPHPSQQKSNSKIKQGSISKSKSKVSIDVQKLLLASKYQNNPNNSTTVYKLHEGQISRIAGNYISSHTSTNPNYATHSSHYPNAAKKKLKCQQMVNKSRSKQKQKNSRNNFLY